MPPASSAAIGRTAASRQAGLAGCARSKRRATNQTRRLARGQSDPDHLPRGTYPQSRWLADDAPDQIRAGRSQAVTWSAWPDLNRQPLRPEAMPVRRSWCGRVGRGAPHLRERSERVVVSPGLAEQVGSLDAPVPTDGAEGVSMFIPPPASRC